MKPAPCSGVTPCVGVWIETKDWRHEIQGTVSHPAWVCGLKRVIRVVLKKSPPVTPCVGVWIETLMA